MILIADSGSTKCDWLLMDSDGNNRSHFHTMGLNPYFHNEEVIEEAIKSNLSLFELAPRIELVFFYGSGASSEVLCRIVERGLKSIFVKAKIHVDHDLVGAAYATYEGEPAITCIIGTGSNSCFFDGTMVMEEVPSLAYILGDEASGSWFGKLLLRDYFYKNLPFEIRSDFELMFQPSKDEILTKIYNEPNANVYLAGFMGFIGKHSNHPHVQQWINDSIRQFIEIHVRCYSNYREVKTHFIGSIGYYFHDSLALICEDEGIHLGKVIQKPIDFLADYHLKYLLKQKNS